MRINNYGFVEVGGWELRTKNLKSGIAFKLNRFADERVIYAFVVEGIEKCVGVCDADKQTLKGRMRNYQNLAGEGANERIAREIKTCLVQGKAVKIFALKPEQSIEYKGLDVDLVKGLKNPLVKILNPEWNKRR